MKKVAILTNFFGYFQAYSLIIVVERQIKMLCDAGYAPKIIVMDGFKPKGQFARPEVELCYAPSVGCSNEWQPEDEQFNLDVKRVAESFEKHFADADVVITHDLFFQAATQRYDAAARIVAKKLPKIRWLHWVHSCIPSRKPKEKFPNSFIVYPNYYDIPRVARGFGVEETDVKVVPHPIDVCAFFDMDKKSEKIIKDNNILNADVIMTYPLRLDRGKQPEICIKIMAQLKKMGRSVKMIFVDFHSTGDEKNAYRKELQKTAADLALNKDEVIFTSEQDKSLEVESPRGIVKDFMCISNVFCLPSRSETFSLVAQEAMICGNFPILNFDFPPIRSIYGDKPLYRKFGSAINFADGLDGATNTTYGDEVAYFRDIAIYICYELEHDKIMSMRTSMRKDFNTGAIFRKYLEPLLYGGME